jgi:hypothetical protein
VTCLSGSTYFGCCLSVDSVRCKSRVGLIASALLLSEDRTTPPWHEPEQMIPVPQRLADRLSHSGERSACLATWHP